MAARPVELHPEAVQEAAEAYTWYVRRNEEVAAAFIAELDRIIARIAEDPASLPLHLRGTQRCSFRRFPYLVVFREWSDVVQVIAVAHGRRRPTYWRERLKD